MYTVVVMSLSLNGSSHTLSPHYSTINSIMHAVKHYIMASELHKNNHE